MKFWDRVFGKSSTWIPNFWSSVYGAVPMFNDYGRDAAKLDVVFSNPALLKVICLQCDLFSLGKIQVKDKAGKVIEDDPFLKLAASPNPFMSEADFKWNFMFWLMVGNCYTYVYSDDVANPINKIYPLDVRKIDFPAKLQDMADRIVLSSKTLKQIMDTELTYRYHNGEVWKFNLDRLTVSCDLTNSVGNWFKGFSRIDALAKVLDNVDEVLKADNINTRYTGKFIVDGKVDTNNTTKTPLPKDEKDSIEEKMNADKQVHATKSPININRFVNDLRVLELDKAYLAKYYVIGMEYNIPRDVLEAYQSSTFDNQEQARSGHITYTLEPKGESFFAQLAKRFGYDKLGKTICISWSHLPCMQTKEKEKNLSKKTIAETFKILMDKNVELKGINKFLGTDFKLDQKKVDEAAAAAQQIQQNNGNQAKPNNGKKDE